MKFSENKTKNIYFRANRLTQKSVSFCCLVVRLLVCQLVGHPKKGIWDTRLHTRLNIQTFELCMSVVMTILFVN